MFGFVTTVLSPPLTNKVAAQQKQQQKSECQTGASHAVLGKSPSTGPRVGSAATGMISDETENYRAVHGS